MDAEGEQGQIPPPRMRKLWSAIAPLVVAGVVAFGLTAVWAWLMSDAQHRHHGWNTYMFVVLWLIFASFAYLLTLSEADRRSRSAWAVVVGACTVAAVIVAVLGTQDAAQRTRDYERYAPAWTFTWPRKYAGQFHGRDNRIIDQPVVNPFDLGDYDAGESEQSLIIAFYPRQLSKDEVVVPRLRLWWKRGDSYLTEPDLVIAPLDPVQVPLSATDPDTGEWLGAEPRPQRFTVTVRKPQSMYLMEGGSDEGAFDPAAIRVVTSVPSYFTGLRVESNCEWTVRVEDSGDRGELLTAQEATLLK